MFLEPLDHFISPHLLLLKKKKLYLYLCVGVCEGVHICVGICEGQRRLSNPGSGVSGSWKQHNMGAGTQALGQQEELNHSTTPPVL